MDWKVKGYIQRALDMTPGGALVNDLLQRLNGGRQNLGGHINVKVRADWLIHMGHLNELGFTLPGKTMLEIGTGWLPVMPLCFALAGISRCITVDLRRHMSVQAVLLTLRHLEPHLADIANVSNQPLEQVNQRWRTWLALNDGQAVLDAAGIVYKALGIPIDLFTPIFAISRTRCAVRRCASPRRTPRGSACSRGTGR